MLECVSIVYFIALGKGISSVISTVEESLGIPSPESLDDGKEGKAVNRETDNGMVVCVLLQSTQLCIEDLVAWWGKQPTQLLYQCVPGVNWGSKCPTVLVLLSGVGVVVKLRVPLHLSVIPGQSPCGLLILPQEDFPEDSGAQAS